MRAIGFLAGVGLTVAAFLLALNTGESRQPQQVSEGTQDATAEQLSVVAARIAEQLDVGQAVIEPDRATPQGHESAAAEREPRDRLDDSGPDPQQQPDQGAESDAAVARDPDPTTAPSDPQSSLEDNQPEADQRLNVEARAQTEDTDPKDSGDASTYLFWSPFRSEWAAQGFAGRLTSVTRIPVEVVNAGPGKYRVAFSYQDEPERLARIRRIETITGLKLE
jgi:hypothetical protein